MASVYVWRLKPNHPISIVSKELSKRLNTPLFDTYQCANQTNYGTLQRKHKKHEDV
jgi:hypothetical protein